MKKILLTILLSSSLLLSNQAIELQEKQIADTKAQIAALQANLKKLEAALPVSVEKQKAIELAKQEEKNKLVTHTEFGFTKTQGNTDTTAFNLDTKLKKAWDKHIFALSIDAHFAEDSGVETKNKYLTELTYDYQFTKRFAFSYLNGLKNDKFSGYDYQFYSGPGAKYKAIVSDKHNLTLDGNVLYSKDKIERTSTVASYTKDYTSLRAKAAYQWQMFDNLKFSQEASYRTEAEKTNNFFVFSKTAFSSKISDIFSAGISYKVDYVNLPATGKEHSDKTLTANLIMDY
ncbi:DUF481 domain-containing protein [Sulfurimonas sp.]